MQKRNGNLYRALQMNIIELAKRAGIDEYEFGYMDITKAELDKFAELVAAHEREECAKVCDEMILIRTDADECAEAIRARSKA
jgi:isopropylmalate/homocitrate/citramalate synthase